MEELHLRVLEVVPPVHVETGLLDSSLTAQWAQCVHLEHWRELASVLCDVLCTRLPWRFLYQQGSTGRRVLA